MPGFYLFAIRNREAQDPQQALCLEYNQVCRFIYGTFHNRLHVLKPNLLYHDNRPRVGKHDQAQRLSLTQFKFPT